MLLACTTGSSASAVAWTLLPKPKFSAWMVAAAPLALTTSPCPPPELVNPAVAALLSGGRCECHAGRARGVGFDRDRAGTDRPTLVPVPTTLLRPTL